MRIQNVKTSDRLSALARNGWDPVKAKEIIVSSLATGSDKRQIYLFVENELGINIDEKCLEISITNNYTGKIIPGFELFNVDFVNDIAADAALICHINFPKAKSGVVKIIFLIKDNVLVATYIENKGRVI